MPGGQGVQELAPLGAEPAAHDAAAWAVLPATQDAQAPEHSEESRPEDAPYVPAGHSEQATAPAGANVPGPHGAQEPAAEPLGTEPAGHDVAAGAKKVLPAAHAAQAPEQSAEVVPALDPKVPAGQSEQEAAPTKE